jgi:heptaprenyl diphosphate synthase
MTTHATPPVLGIPGATPDLSARLRDGLGRVDALLTQVVDHDDPFIARASGHLVEAGGKRFRPLLVVLASQFGGEAVPEDVVKAAVVVELTHVASLYHDDVMDEALIRRAAPSANARWGNTIAILVGDFLFARASDLVAELGTEYVKLQARTFARLVQGQIAETIGPGESDPLEHYLAVMADKTGSLIATSAVFGAKLAGASPEVQSAMQAFGEEIGIVFQLSDDIIDISSDETGKTPGTDLREGVPTLPILLARRSTDPADARLRELLNGDLSSDDAVAEAVALLRRHRALDEARAEVRRRADRARTLLAPLPDGPAKVALADLCDTVVTRTS